MTVIVLDDSTLAAIGLVVLVGAALLMLVVAALRR